MCTSKDESYSIAMRYRTVKKRLDNLGYREALSLDALPLTEKLLADLIQTTESLKHFKAIADNNIESCRQSSLSIDPHNYDNTKLVQECNELHNQLLEVKQNNLIQIKDLKRKIQRLESECSDLQLASSRNLKRIKDLELESSNKSKKIQELLGKCCKPIISNAGLASKKRSAYPLRKPVLESEPLPTEINGVIQYPNLTKINPQIVDVVSMADRKISSLNHEVIKLKDELSLQTDNVDTLKTQLTMKEKEINRLKKLHDGGRSYNVALTECSCHKSEPSCGQCNFINRRTTGNYSQSVCNKLGEISEVKILQQAKLNLEQQLRDALDKQHDAMSQAMQLAERNEELEKELRDIDHVALAVEADCNSTVKQNNKRVSQLKEKLENTMQKIRDLENDLLVEKRLSQELRADLEGCKLEKRNVQRTLDNSLDERKRLTDRINELTIIENDLTDEIGRLSKYVETQKYALAEFKLANDALKKQTHEGILTENAEKKNGTRFNEDKIKKTNNFAVSNDQKYSLSTVGNNNTNNMNSNGNNGYGEVSDDTTNKGIKKMTDDSRKLIEQLERDRDYYKDQWNKLNKASDTENAELWSKICDLKHQLNEKEAQISELQRDKRGLSREKFNLENRVQMTPHSRNPCNYCKVCPSMNACVCPSSARTNGKTNAGPKILLTRLEQERDTARADIERLTKERSVLHERLELATEAHTNEQRRSRDRVRELENKLDELKTENQNILISQGNRQSTLSSLEDQLKDANNELRMVKQELAAQRTQYFQLRALQDQTDQALGDVQSQLTQAESELTRALDRNKILDQQQLQMDNQIIELKQEINTLRSNMARLDSEKDQLLINLDEKTEQIAALEREVMMKEQQTIGVDQQLRDLLHKNQINLEQSAEHDRHLRSMQIEMENYQRQLNAADVDREHALRENKRLQNDLAAVTCETRTLQHELQASHAESFDLKRQLQTYVSEVRRAEELLNKKENERTEMLNHFRSLSLEATVLENNNQSLESEAAEAKGALQSTRDRLMDLEGQLADKECQIRRYEAQIKELSGNIANLEIQVRQQIELRDGMELDLNALRDLCVKLDEQKDSLQEELNNCAAMKVRYEAQMSKLENEQKAANDQRNRDRAAVDSLEKLLEQETRNSMECRRLNQELQNEIGRLKERVSDLQNKLSTESAKLRGCLNQAAEYDKQIADLRRKVTDEKFHRAQIEEEHRRVNQYNGDKSIKPTEYNVGEPVKGTSQIVTFDTTNANEELSHGSLRPHQELTGHREASTRPINSIHAAENTNRFEPGIGLYKDKYMKVNEPKVSFFHIPGVGEPVQPIAMPGSGSISVKTIVEENANHKDIRLQITEQPIMNKRALFIDDASTKNESSSSTNSAHMVTSKSYTPMEVHQDHDVNIIPDEKIEDVTISNADQIKNGVLYKSNTTDKKIPSKLNLHNLSAVEKESSIILNNDTQPKVAVEDKYNEGYRVARDVDIEQRDVETQVFERRIRKERCGCSINNKLSNCNARNYKERSHVGFELDINDNYNDDEGYNTARSPKSIGISTNVENITSKDNFSLKKPNSSVMKVSEPSQSSLPKFSLPPSTNYPDSTPEKITSEDSEIVIPTINIDTADMNKNLIDVQKMANSMQNQLALMNRLKSKYMSNINNNGKSGNDSVKQTNKVHVETTYCDELTPGLFTTPGKLQSRDKSNKQQLSKNNYPSDDEHHMPIRHRNVTENAISDKKLGNSDTEETNRRSESPRNRIKANENSARASSSRPVNAETQSSQTQVEAGTSYSYVDAIQSSPRYRRQNKRQSSESSQSPNKNRSTRSKVHDVNTKSPAKSFLGSSSSYEQVNDESSFRHKKSKNNAITQIPKRQYQSRSRPSTRERATPKSQSPVARSTTPTYIRNRYNEKFEC